MISNITFEEAQSLANKIGKIEGVTSVTFDDSGALLQGFQRPVDGNHGGRQRG